MTDLKAVLQRAPAFGAPCQPEHSTTQEKPFAGPGRMGWVAPSPLRSQRREGSKEREHDAVDTNAINE
jgi:hypothetical protein